jgi:hypothetical protein
MIPVSFEDDIKMEVYATLDELPNPLLSKQNNMLKDIHYISSQ